MTGYTCHLSMLKAITMQWQQLNDYDAVPTRLLQVFHMCFQTIDYIKDIMILLFHPSFNDLSSRTKMLQQLFCIVHKQNVKKSWNIESYIKYCMGLVAHWPCLQKLYSWCKIWHTNHCLLPSRKRLYIKIAIRHFLRSRPFKGHITCSNFWWVLLGTPV